MLCHSPWGWRGEEANKLLNIAPEVCLPLLCSPTSGLPHRPIGVGGPHYRNSTLTPQMNWLLKNWDWTSSLWGGLVILGSALCMWRSFLESLCWLCHLADITSVLTHRAFPAGCFPWPPPFPLAWVRCPSLGLVHPLLLTHHRTVNPTHTCLPQNLSICRAETMSCRHDIDAL